MWKKVLIAIVVIAAIAGVGLFILDRTLFAPAPVSTGVPMAPTLAAPAQAPTQAAAQPTDPPAATETAQPQTAPEATATTASAANTAIIYRIDAGQSEARYEVGETFFQGNRFNLAIGRTKGLAGEVLVDFANPANSQVGTIVIDVNQLTSDEGRRDNYIRNNALQSSQYPQASFTPTQIEGLPAGVQPGDQITFRVTGDLTVKQTTRPVTFDVTLTADQDKLTGTASTEILLSDFDAGPIQLAMLQTEDKAKLVFDFVALPAQETQ
jgi:polyisoprenoid-binding protein YceI